MTNMSQSDVSIDLAAGADAFGDGSHPSTRCAMAALQELHKLMPMYNILDMGCGAGLLSIQAASLWQRPVLAVDKEQTALDALEHNVRHNNLTELVTPLRSEGYAAKEIKANGPYDLIICNIIAEILITLAKDTRAHLATDDGIAVLSGILRWREHQVREAYDAAGLTLINRLQMKDWVALIYQNQ